MRSMIRGENGFLMGIVAGLAFGGVALLTAEAMRRLRARRHAHEETIIGIDAHEARGPSLAVRPAEEGNSVVRRLASELPDFVPLSQRW